MRLRDMLCLVVFLVSAWGSQAKLCQGLELVQSGVDIATFDLYGPPSANYRAMKFTYTQNLTFSNPYTNGVCSVPDQIGSIEAVPETISSDDATYAFSFASLLSSKSNSVSAGVGFDGFSFSGSHSFQSQQSLVVARTRAVETVNGYISATSVAGPLPFLFTPSEGFLETVKRMPTNYTGQRIFSEFIEYFGTHYWEKFVLGGVYQYTALTSKQYISAHSASKTKDEAGASFMSYVHASGGHSSGSNAVATDFTKDSRISVAQIGGTPCVDNGTACWGEWAKTVPENPRILQGKLHSFGDVVSNIINDQVGAALQTAIEQHVYTTLAKNIVKDLHTLNLKGVSGYHNDSSGYRFCSGWYCAPGHAGKLLCAIAGCRQGCDSDGVFYSPVTAAKLQVTNEQIINATHEFEDQKQRLIQSIQSELNKPYTEFTTKHMDFYVKQLDVLSDVVASEPAAQFCSCAQKPYWCAAPASVTFPKNLLGYKAAPFSF
eukprot:TRINITY_DN67979_c2_g9_i1.p1 TRINITY_DN67979_c2_g9~~TRINITY_DN67979_c2_g9_i1.p1  ORF type:complete len:489 (+),score=30.03 TRINITY_DN67979_c2_g9_i1:25-1491(+)